MKPNRRVNQMIPAFRLCTVPGCGALFSGRACPEQHAKRTGARHWRKVYGDGWEVARKQYLLQVAMAQQWHHPCCEDCLATPASTRTRAVEVHHRIKVAEGGSRYDPANLMALCSACHRVRTERGE